MILHLSALSQFSSPLQFQGTNQQQDTRFSDKEKKLLKQMKFGDCLNKRVDMSKVKLDVLRPWISKKITDILHIEDDVVVEFVYNQLEEEKVSTLRKHTHKIVQFSLEIKNVFRLLLSLTVSLSKEDANQHDWLFKWQKCTTIYG